MSLSERANMAMREAVQGVVEDHMRTGRPLIIWKDGKVVKAASCGLRFCLSHFLKIMYTLR